MRIKNLRDIEEMIILPQKRKEILSKLRQLLIKWNSIKYLNY